nr:hypothetical protein [Streptomyces sp. MBT84]
MLWQHSAGARARLVERQETGDGVATLFDLLLEIFDEQGIQVILR